MITRQEVIDRIEIMEDGVIQVRHATYFVEDGVRLGPPAYTRSTLTPINTLPPAADARLRRVAVAVHTPDVVDAYREKHNPSRAIPLDEIGPENRP